MPESKPDPSPERLAEIRAKHEQYGRGAHNVKAFEAVDDCLKALKQRDTEVLRLQAVAQAWRP